MRSPLHQMTVNQLPCGAIVHLATRQAWFSIKAIAHLHEGKSVLEGLDSQLGQEGRLRGADLVTRLDQVDIVHNLDGSLVDLGCDTKGLVWWG